MSKKVLTPERFETRMMNRFWSRVNKNGPTIRQELIFAGTRADNMRDRFSKRRKGFGGSRARRLTPALISSINAALDTSTDEAISAATGVSVTRIRRLRNRKHWRVQLAA